MRKKENIRRRGSLGSKCKADNYLNDRILKKLQSLSKKLWLGKRERARRSRQARETKKGKKEVRQKDAGSGKARPRRSKGADAVYNVREKKKEKKKKRREAAVCCRGRSFVNMRERVTRLNLIMRKIRVKGRCPKEGENPRLLLPRKGVVFSALRANAGLIVYLPPLQPNTEPIVSFRLRWVTLHEYN